MLWVWICLVTVLAVGLQTALIYGWRPFGVVNMPPLGATERDCEAIFGKPLDANSNMEWLHRPSRLYTKYLWALIVSDDEQRRAEQFIICKSPFWYKMKSPEINGDEQETLLGRLSGGSTWQSSKKIDLGPTWTRKDDDAYAMYDTEHRWLIVMNKAGLKRFLKENNMELIDEPTPSSPR